MCSAEPFQNYLKSQHLDMFCCGIENSSVLSFLNVLIDRTHGFQPLFIGSPRLPVCLQILIVLFPYLLNVVSSTLLLNCITKFSRHNTFS